MKGTTLMNITIVRISTLVFCTALLALTLGRIADHSPVSAQENAAVRRGGSGCTNGTASGTYGYRMSGQIIGVGPILVNGLFTHDPNGTISGNVYLNIAGQTIPNASWVNGTFTTNDDCTGSGSFFVAALNTTITYNFIATDGGRQIDLLNTNAGNSFHGAGRRINQHGRAPSCTNGTVLGAYGYRLEGSLPGVPAFIGAGILTHSLDANSFNGVTAGSDTNGFNGQYSTRTFQGTYQLKSDCTGTGTYLDSLGNTINYVFVTVDGGEEIYFQGIDPGQVVSGVGRRVK
jgi:hypothetical protein